MSDRSQFLEAIKAIERKPITRCDVCAKEQVGWSEHIHVNVAAVKREGMVDYCGYAPRRLGLGKSGFQLTLCSWQCLAKYADKQVT
jgi:hypothetical protein